MSMRSFEQDFSEIREAIFAIVDALGAALPRTPAVETALEDLYAAELGNGE